MPKKEKTNNNEKIIKTIKNGILPQKEFKIRNSLLTDLFEIDHFKSIRHCFVAILIILSLNILICDMLGTGSVTYGFRYILIGFGQFDKVIVIWLGMICSTISIYPVFYFWAKIRFILNPKSLLLKAWDRVWLIAFLAYIAIFFYFPIYFKGINFPIASSAVILGEQIRMLMKSHGFIRSNVPRVKSFKPHTEKNEPIPNFSKYLYYLFIPTFVYKDEYPRTKIIRWSFVATNFIELFAGIILYSFLTANYLVPDFTNFGLEPLHWRTIIMLVFRTILPASMIMLVGFYVILHSWMNAWAEMLRFGDRLFYLDWWNTVTYSAYYRKWNIVVHDYLHAFIYRDMFEIVMPGNKVVAQCSVFLISALVHEYIIGIMLGFFFPVMFVQFLTLGLMLNFIKLKERQFIGNTFLWWSLSTGIGMQISLYAMEYYARINCPKANETLSDFFVPRMFSCNNFKNI